MTKYVSIADILALRIQEGDYRLSSFPTEEALATEFEVSRMTARKALQTLMSRGVLQRKLNQRIEVGSLRPAVQAKKPAIAVLVPAYASPIFDFWRSAVERVGRSMGCEVRPAVYQHWHDPTILRVLRSFDGVFLSFLSEEIPEAMLRRFSRHNPPVAAFSRNLDDFGIPTVDLFPVGCGSKVLDHLYALGHRRISCFNIHPNKWAMDGRIATWRTWLKSHNVTGEFLDIPVDSYGNPWEGSYQALAQRLANESFNDTAIYCTTAPCAAGAIRALHEHGYIVGKDISVCATNDEGWAQYFSPSLTCLLASDMDEQIRHCIQWMLSEGHQWNGPLHLCPDSINLFVGTSTAAPRKSRGGPYT